MTDRVADGRGGPMMFGETTLVGNGRAGYYNLRAVDVALVRANQTRS
jgi:hypothetical protein